MVTLYAAYSPRGSRTHAAVEAPTGDGRVPDEALGRRAICGTPVFSGGPFRDFMADDNFGLCCRCLRRRSTLILQERRRHHEAVVLRPATPRTPT